MDAKLVVLTMYTSGSHIKNIGTQFPHIQNSPKDLL